MYLEELVIENFKSFGERTRLPLRDDFTAITGPNGSGKSNILDAIQFALGLGRVSDVRARRLTDLIHHTDEQEPRLPREAEVTVIVNNEDGVLSADQLTAAIGDTVLDPDRFEIKRRIRQTPNNSYSYYYIDDKKVNLGDIRELMYQAGVSDDRYNIVPQGDITELINLTPMQRRLIIDEIAGVAEFDEKKRQAQAELETVRERIEEVKLRIEEKAETLDKLADEREEALIYQELAEEKDEYERYRHAAELNDRQTQLEETVDRIKELDTELAQQRVELATAEEEATRIEEDIEDLTEEIERKGGEEQRELQHEIETLRNEIGQLEGRIEEKRERISSRHDDRRDAELKLDRKQEALEDLEADRRDLKVRKADRVGDLVEHKDELAEVEAAIGDLDEEQRRLNGRLQRQEHLLDEAVSTRDDLQRGLDRLYDEARRRDRERDEIASTLDELESLLEDRNDEQTGVDREMERVRSERTGIQATIEELTGERESVESTLTEVTGELDEAKARFADIQRQQRDAGRGQFPKSVARVLGAGIDGVHGAVASLGDVEDETYATACEAAGGGRLANLVVDTPSVAQAGIEYLKQRNAGRATFLPISEFDRRSLPPRPDHGGVIDFARNLVTYDDRYEGIFSYILGSTLVVEDLDVAREFMGEFRMVTLEGDVVERSGAMRGGSKREAPFRFGGARNRLKRLAASIEGLEADRDELLEQKSAIEDDLAEASERDRTLRDDLRDLERERAALTDRITQLEGQQTSKEDQLDAIEAAKATTIEEIDALETQMAAAVAGVEAISAAVDQIKAALADTRLGELTSKRDALQAQIGEIQSDVDQLNAQSNEVGLEIAAAEERIGELRETIEGSEDDIDQLEAEIEELEGDIAEIDTDIDARLDEIAALEDDLTELKATRESRREDLGDARDEVNHARMRVAEIERELDPLRADKEQLEWEIAELTESVEALEEVEEVPDLEVVTERIATLEAKLTAMEPVNHKAVEQYDRLAEEVDGLQTDVEELDSERTAILERIDSYEAEKREAFMEAYEAIDTEYREVFRTLSGGSAELELEDEENPFEGGLVMRAQPEDKFVGSLEQLSGGEKSLTALSLIFAIQRYRPAPFYALDEIDAFLDAANLDRIGGLLETHRDDGQFIVISHHADLLERADRIIGVSMPEDRGASQVSGIHLGGRGVPADD